MRRWPVPDTQAWPTGWRLALAVACVVVAVVISQSAGWGLPGAAVLSVVAVLIADGALRKRLF